MVAAVLSPRTSHTNWAIAAPWISSLCAVRA